MMFAYEIDQSNLIKVAPHLPLEYHKEIFAPASWDQQSSGPLDFPNVNQAGSNKLVNLPLTHEKSWLSIRNIKGQWIEGVIKLTLRWCILIFLCRTGNRNLMMWHDGWLHGHVQHFPWIYMRWAIISGFWARWRYLVQDPDLQKYKRTPWRKKIKILRRVK